MEYRHCVMNKKMTNYTVYNCSSICCQNNVMGYYRTNNQQSHKWSLILWYYQDWHIIISGPDPVVCQSHIIIQSWSGMGFQLLVTQMPWRFEQANHSTSHWVTQWPTPQFSHLLEYISYASIQTPLLSLVQVAYLLAWWWPSWHGLHTSLHPQTFQCWMLPQILE